jgi:hypothetical protein
MLAALSKRRYVTLNKNKGKKQRAVQQAYAFRTLKKNWRLRECCIFADIPGCARVVPTA